MTNPNVDLNTFLAFRPPDLDVSYNRRDLILYALGINATDLIYTNEDVDGFGAFPTYPVVLSFKSTSSDIVPFGSTLPRYPGLSFDPGMILHGEQSLEVLKHPLPTEGHFKVQTKILGLWDKGKGAVIPTESVLVDEKGQKLVKMCSSTFIRGLGGFGGDKGPTVNIPSPPNRTPDFVHEEKTSETQALLYRLSGDYNQLHANPMFAQMFGFQKPILHGLCSFGIATNSIIKSVCGNDPTKFKSISVRFMSPVYPGETLITEMWKNGNKVIFQTSVKERNVKVMGNCVAELFENPVSKL